MKKPAKMWRYWDMVSGKSVWASGTADARKQLGLPKDGFVTRIAHVDVPPPAGYEKTSKYEYGDIPVALALKAIEQ